MKARTKSPKSNSKAGLEARLVATMLLTRVVDDARNVDALCDQQHGLAGFLKLDARDQGLVRAIVITALRNRLKIEHALSRMMDRPPPKKARFLIHSLHVAAAQILFLDLPDSAAVDLGVTAIGDDERTGRFRGMANAVLRRLVREKEDCLKNLEGKVSPFPKWFEQTLRKDHGREKSALVAEAVFREPLVDLSVKSDPEGWAEKLGGFVLPTGSVRLTTQNPVETLEGYTEGEWWVQDTAASIPAKLVHAKSGEKVLELCAAPGGKTAQLAHAGHDVTALDISKPRLARLQQNLDRLKLKAALIEADILEWKPEAAFDWVLLDAPCSSSGTVRRHPDVIWTKSAEDVTALAELQFRLIEKAQSLVKPGGKLIFSNCSLFKEEGENLLVRVQKEFQDLIFSPITADEITDTENLINGQGALRTLPYHMAKTDIPAQGGMDGFFACRFTKA